MADAPPVNGLKPMHPGEWLREDVMPALKESGVSLSEVARAVGVSRRTLYDILGEKASVTPEMAVKLGAVLGTSAELWANLQQRYDLAQARRKIGDQLPQRIPYEAA
jgi:addiction module HigA family antidote